MKQMILNSILSLSTVFILYLYLPCDNDLNFFCSGLFYEGSSLLISVTFYSLCISLFEEKHQNGLFKVTYCYFIGMLFIIGCLDGFKEFTFYLLLVGSCIGIFIAAITARLENENRPVRSSIFS